MYHGDSCQEDEAIDTVMAAVYRQLDDHDLGTDTPFDTESGLRRLAEQMHRGDQPGTLRTSIPSPGTPLDFRLLGTFQMTAGGRLADLGPAQEQRMLVALLDAKGAPVSQAWLMNAIWDDQPERALDALYSHVSRLRRRLVAAGYPGVLTGARGTYKLALPAECVDVHRFHALVDRARQLARDNGRQSVALLEEALGLHQGEPLAGLRGRWIDRYRYALLEDFRAAELALYETAIGHGESRERLPALHALYRDRPDDEWVAWLLMHALYRAGRQAEALDVPREVSRHLNEPISSASMKALGNLYERILRQDDNLLRPEAIRFPAGEATTQDKPGAGTSSTHGTRDQVARAIRELGPSTAAALGGRLGLPPAAVRRHLDNLIAEGLVEELMAGTYGNRARGRPAKLFAMTDPELSASKIAAKAEGSGDTGATVTPVLALQLELTYRVEADGRAMVRVRGELDITTADQAYAYLREVVDSQTGPITINIAGLTFCDAAGLGVLARVAGHARRHGRPVQFADARPSLLRIMRITGMDEAFPEITSLPAPWWATAAGHMGDVTTKTSR